MSAPNLYPDPPRPRAQRPATLIIYHAQCADGFTAAWAAWRIFGRNAEYLPADHARPPVADVRGRHVFVLDFSFRRDVLIEMARQAASLVLLDHHLTAARDLAGLSYAHVDQSKSGALLAWDYFFPDRSAPRLVEHINDRDLGVWRSPRSRPFLSWLERIPRTFHNWERIVAMNMEDYALAIEAGTRMQADAQRRAAAIATQGAAVRLFDIEGLAVECPQNLACEVGPLLARRCGTFSLCWTPLEDGRVRVSVQSLDSIDSAAIAQRFGGGGHAHKAGFVLERAAFHHVLGHRPPPGAPGPRSMRRWLRQAISPVLNP